MIAAALAGALVTLAVVHFGEGSPAPTPAVAAPTASRDVGTAPAAPAPGGEGPAATAPAAAFEPSGANRPPEEGRTAEAPRDPPVANSASRVRSSRPSASSAAPADRRRRSSTDTATPSRRPVSVRPVPAPELLQEVQEVVSDAVGYATVEVRAPAGSKVEIDGILHGQAPFSEPLRIPAGTHLIRVTLGRGVYDTRLSARAGEEYTLDVEFIGAP